MKTKNIRAWEKDIDRIKKYGIVGDSMARALSNALDQAEKKNDN